MAHQDQVLQERRQDVRRPVHITALLDRHGLTPRVVIVDYSRGGLRIDRAFEVAVGEHVTVELLSGHRMPVEVVWAVGARSARGSWERYSLGIRPWWPLRRPPRSTSASTGRRKRPDPSSDLPAASALKAASVCAARNQHEECRAGGDQQQHRRAQSLMMDRATSSQSIQKAATSRVTLRRAGSRMKEATASQTWEA